MSEAHGIGSQPPESPPPHPLRLLRILKRSGIVLVVLLLTALALTAAGGQAGSLPAVSGMWTMTSDPGDWVGQGQSYSFGAPADGIELGSGVGMHGVGFVAYPGGVLWSGLFGAPVGAELVPGVYTDATRFGDETHPRLDVDGAGRGCNATTGEFTVLDVSYGPYGYLKSAHLTFEQHCEGATPALRGEIDVVGPPPPPALEVHLSVADSVSYDRADGSIKLQGTISCSQDVQARISGQVTEATKKGQASASLNLTPICSPTPTAWKVKLVSATANPFAPGTLQATVTLSAVDDYYSRYNNYSPFIYATDTASLAIAAKPGA